MIDEDIMEKIIPIPDEEEEMENIEAELAEADFPITNFKKGGVFYHIIRMFVTLFIELKQLARTILNSCFILRSRNFLYSLCSFHAVRSSPQRISGNSLYTFPFPVTTRIPLQEILSTNTGKFPLCT